MRRVMRILRNSLDIEKNKNNDTTGVNRSETNININLL